MQDLKYEQQTVGVKWKLDMTRLSVATVGFVMEMCLIVSFSLLLPVPASTGCLNCSVPLWKCVFRYRVWRFIVQVTNSLQLQVFVLPASRRGAGLPLSIDCVNQDSICELGLHFIIEKLWPFSRFWVAVFHLLSQTRKCILRSVCTFGASCGKTKYQITVSFSLVVKTKARCSDKQCFNKFHVCHSLSSSKSRINPFTVILHPGSH